MTRTLLLGSPGTGKTESLLKRVDEALASGIKPHEIAFVTFTNAAADEAKERACKMFGLEPKHLTNFRTIHSLCFRELGTKRSDILKKADLHQLSLITGERLVGKQVDASNPLEDTTGDTILFLEQYARATGTTLRAAWQAHGEQLDWFRTKRLADAYRVFKLDRMLVDFTDLLEEYVTNGGPINYIKLAIVDEAQDLTRLQWRVIDKAFGNVPEMLVGGDDDQAIHTWAGAATAHFLALPYEKRYLQKSHRLTAAVFNYAQRIISRIKHRFNKPTQPDSRVGTVEQLQSTDHVDLRTGTWLVLARTQHLAGGVVDEARRRGLLYFNNGVSSVVPEHIELITSHEQQRQAQPSMPPWHDALTQIPIGDREYYLTCRRQGEKLLSPPRIRISTIHGSKGKQADNVLLLTDISQRVERGMELDQDSEHRVFYVGATRARERLCVVAPQYGRGYSI